MAAPGDDPSTRTEQLGWRREAEPEPQIRTTHAWPITIVHSYKRVPFPLCVKA